MKPRWLKFALLPGLFAGTFLRLTMYFHDQMEINRWLALAIGLTAGFLTAWIMEAPLEFFRAIPEAWRRSHLKRHRRIRRFQLALYKPIKRWKLVIPTVVFGLNFGMICGTFLFSLFSILPEGEASRVTPIKMGLIGLAGGVICGICISAFGEVNIKAGSRQECYRSSRSMAIQTLPFVWPFTLAWRLLKVLPLVVRFIGILVVGLGSFIFQLFLIVHSQFRLTLAVDTCAGILVGSIYWNPWIAAVAGAAFGFFNYAIILRKWLIRYEYVRVRVGHRL